MTERRAALNLVVLLMLVLLLSACGRNTTPPAPTTPTPREISGTAEGWPGGEAVVRAETTEFSIIAEGTISADGSFSLTLPVEGAELANALTTADGDSFCSSPDSVSTIEIAPGPFKTVFIANYFYVYDSTGSELLGYLSTESTPQDSFNNAYASSNVTVKGDCVTTYGNESSTLRFDLDYKAGWNAIFSTESGAVLSVSTRQFPAGTGRWTYVSEEVPPGEEGPPTDPPSPPCEPDDPECAPPVTPA